MNGFKQSFVAKQIVSDNPVVKLDFIEGSLALQLAPLVSFFPFFFGEGNDSHTSNILAIMFDELADGWGSPNTR